MVIKLLERDRRTLSRCGINHLNSLCLIVIETAKYPPATALYLSAYMKRCAQMDESRVDQFNEMMQKYTQIAKKILEQIESNHLLAILLEIPSDIENKSILKIAIDYKLEEFLDFHRLQTSLYFVCYYPTYILNCEQFLLTCGESLNI